MAQRIGVYYAPVKGVPGAYHAGLYYRLGPGPQSLEILEAVPEVRDPGTLAALLELIQEGVLGERNPDTPFRRLVTNNATAIPEGAIENSLVDGLALGPIWDGLKATFDDVGKGGYSYYPKLQNSNSVVGTALERQGIRWTVPEVPNNPRNNRDYKPGGPPFIPNPNPPWTPGADRRLILDQDVERPTYLLTPMGDVTGSPNPVSYAPRSSTEDRFENSLDGLSPDIPSRRLGGGLRRAPAATTIAANESPTPPGPVPLLGFVSGEPMLPQPFPSQIFGLPDKFKTSGNVDTFNRLAGVGAWNPLQAASPPDSTMPVRSLGRVSVDPQSASDLDQSPGAVPLVRSVDSNFSGGLLGRLMAVVGIDPREPARLAPPLDDDLHGFYRDDPSQPWLGRRPG